MSCKKLFRRRAKGDGDVGEKNVFFADSVSIREAENVFLTLKEYFFQ